jgi:hypothetical protein
MTEHPHDVDPTGQRVTPPPPPRATAEAEHALKNGQPGLGTAAKNFADHLSALVRLEIELAQLEINRKVSLIAKGLIMAGIAALLVLYLIGFGLAAAAAGIATQLPVWASLLIVAGVLLLAVAILGLLAKRAIEKGAPPLPEQAIREAKLTTEALKGDAHPEAAKVEEVVKTDAG